MSKKKDESSYEFEGIDSEAVQKRSDAIANYSRVKKELESCRNEKREYLEGWQRAKADYANLMNSSEEEKKRARKIIREQVILDFLPALDSFEIAFNDKEHWESAPPEWRRGIESIYNQLLSALKNHGVRLYDDRGKTFDPIRHHSHGIIETSNEDEDGKILDIIQRGCECDDFILRPALVRVGEYKKK